MRSRWGRKVVLSPSSFRVSFCTFARSLCWDDVGGVSLTLVYRAMSCEESSQVFSFSVGSERRPLHKTSVCIVPASLCGRSSFTMTYEGGKRCELSEKRRHRGVSAAAPVCTQNECIHQHMGPTDCVLCKDQRPSSVASRTDALLCVYTLFKSRKRQEERFSFRHRSLSSSVIRTDSLLHLLRLPPPSYQVQVEEDSYNAFAMSVSSLFLLSLSLSLRSSCFSTGRPRSSLACLSRY